MPLPTQQQTKRGSAVATAIALAVAVATPFTAGHEGYVGKVYVDVTGTKTQCYGETHNLRPDLIYTKGQCMDKLQARLAAAFAPAIAQCVPDFADPRRHNQFAALIDASYNAGPSRTCRSPMAVAFRAGEWIKGCHAFVGWYVTSKGVPLRGLVNRRNDERALCLKGVMA